MGRGAVGSNMYALWDGLRSDRCKKIFSVKKDEMSKRH